MSIVVIGADIGQKHDPTALVVCEYERILIGVLGDPLPEETALDWFNIELGLDPPPLYDTRYIVRSTRRLPLGLPYPAVAVHINAICDYVRSRYAAQDDDEVCLAVDATGVGAPVVDLIRAQIREDVAFTAVTITGTDKCPESPLAKANISMGKAWMVSRLQALLQSRRLRMPASPDARELAKELGDFEIRVGRDAHAEMGAFRTGTHDDLVTALGLAVLGEAHTQVTYTPLAR